MKEYTLYRDTMFTHLTGRSEVVVMVANSLQDVERKARELEQKGFKTRII